jgi:transcriptional regulator with PAS, ATPase and Fis domain
MQSILSILPSVSESSSSVLIQGETGTGKEVLARTIHTQSPRKNKPFIAVNCGALPESLLESELFGYKKGAFTGADKDKPGRFALAEGGTLFLDEIGDISAAMQVKLLRVLQEHEYEPLGAVKPVKTDVRILCATNKDLLELIKKDKFRQDLYYRINVITIMLPGLKDRKEDIADIAQSFLEIYSTRMNKTISGFDSEVFKFFYEYSWPGNIRELENIVERMTVLAKDNLLTIDLIPSTLIEHNEKNFKPEEETVEQARDKAERECIIKALKNNSWNKTKTALDLNIDKATLWRKMKKLNIEA